MIPRPCSQIHQLFCSFGREAGLHSCKLVLYNNILLLCNFGVVSAFSWVLVGPFSTSYIDIYALLNAIWRNRNGKLFYNKVKFLVAGKIFHVANM